MITIIFIKSSIFYFYFLSLFTDADKAFTLNAIAGAAFGAAGQR